MTRQIVQRRPLFFGILVVLLMLSRTAGADGIHFLEVGATSGFDVVWSSPTIVMATDATFYEADPSGMGEVQYTGQQQLINHSTPDPNDDVRVGDAYTSVVTLTLLPPLPDPPAGLGSPNEILLLVAGMDTFANLPDYETDMVSFRSDPNEGDTPFEELIWYEEDESLTRSYIGFIMMPGDTVQFRYDVTRQLLGGTPPIITSATYDYSIVPEPSTALLMGIGLWGLSIYGRRH